MINAILNKDSTGKENHARERQEVEKTKWWGVRGTDKMIRGKREREREREREWLERRAALERKRARVYPARSQLTTNVSKWFKFRVNVDQVRFHGLYWYVCARIFIESRLACLATDINEILYLHLTFLLTLEQVSVTLRQLPNLPVFCGGEGGGGSEQNTGMPIFWQMRKFTDGP